VLLIDGSRSEAKADRAAADFRKSSLAGMSGATVGALALRREQ
jgi:hypothetical protein